ncbi:hypothetical protein HDU67_007915 [Dinochytrium kinnereticum]|nr:hypothetical protein HDU67_007915 [Dinochytrium kinnereticum]
MSEELAHLEALISGSGRSLTDTIRSILTWCGKALESKDLHASLYLFMPSLCTFLFGGSKDPSHTGVLHRALSERDRVALTNLLAPESTFMRLILRMSGDSTLLYEISLNRLPPPTQRLIKAGDLGALPKIYQSRIVSDSSRVGSSNVEAPFPSRGAKGGFGSETPSSYTLRQPIAPQKDGPLQVKVMFKFCTAFFAVH